MPDFIFSKRRPTVIVLCLLLSIHSIGQRPDFKIIPLGENWHLDLKTGTAAILSPIPDQYLKFINNINIPLNTPGFLGAISLKKSITPHFMSGYQYDYIRIKGYVNVADIRAQVLTKAYIHSFLFQYDFIKTDEETPPFDYFLTYRIGTISLRNFPTKDVVYGNINGNTIPENKLISNAAILTSIGGGINYRINDLFNLTGSIDLNRSTGALADIIQIQKLFFHSSHTVNNYITASVGVSYFFNLAGQKNSSSFKPNVETKRRVNQIKKAQKKRKTIFSRHNTRRQKPGKRHKRWLPWL